MGKAYVNNLVHLVFSTKRRQRWLEARFQPEVEKFMTECLKRLGCKVIAIKAVDDHIHVLFAMGKMYGIARIVGDIKQASTRMLKGKNADLWDFRWQTGYGWFSISESHVSAAKNYVMNQEEHHKFVSFKDEMRAMFVEFGIEFDEQYAWG